MTDSVSYLALDHGTLSSTGSLNRSLLEMGKDLIDKVFRSSSEETRNTLKQCLSEHIIKLISILPYDEGSSGLCTTFNTYTGFVDTLGNPISTNRLELLMYLSIQKLELPEEQKETILRRIYRCMFFYTTILDLYNAFIADPILKNHEDVDIKLLNLFLSDSDSFSKIWSTVDNTGDISLSSNSEFKFFKEWSHDRGSYLRERFGPFGLLMNSQEKKFHLYEEVFTSDTKSEKAVQIIIAKAIVKNMTDNIVVVFNITDEEKRVRIYLLLLSTIFITPYEEGGEKQYSFKIKYNILHLILLSILLGKNKTIVNDTACNDGNPEEKAETGLAPQESQDLFSSLGLGNSTIAPAPSSLKKRKAEEIVTHIDRTLFDRTLFDEIVNSLLQFNSIERSTRSTDELRDDLQQNLFIKVNELNLMVQGMTQQMKNNIETMPGKTQRVGGKKVKPKRSKRCKQTKKSKSKKHRRTRKATII
jgi:hypothetical protein